MQRIWNRFEPAPATPTPPAEEAAPAAERASRPVLLFALISDAASLTALSALLRVLPASLPAALLLVQEAPAHRFDDLVAWLQRRTRLHVSAVHDRDPAIGGCLHVAPPDLHLVFRSSGRLRLVDGPVEHDRRPSADVLLRSLASAGPQAAAVFLAGAGDDGAAGLATLRYAGGHALVRAGASATVLTHPSVLPQDVVPDDKLSERMLALAAH